MKSIPTARIAWKPLGDEKMPGSRLRAYLPARHLREAGWNTEIFDDRKAETYDLVIFQKIYQRDTIALAERLKKRGTKLVFDLCDNHFYNPDGNPTLHERAQRLYAMINMMDAVSVSTFELSKLIAGKTVEVIDDPIDYQRVTPWLDLRLKAERLLNPERRSRVKFVWHGTAGLPSPPTGLINIQRVLPYLQDLNRTVPLSLTVISNSRELFEKYASGADFPVRYVDWDLTTFAYNLKQNDVCIIPISTNPFTICKTNNRLVSSLLFGLPVVADPIPSYQEFSQCVLFGNWTDNLRTYATDPKLRRMHVRKAQQYIRSKYTPSRVVTQWSGLFRKLLDGKSAEE